MASKERRHVAVKAQTQYADQREMRGIVDVEEPLHALPLSSFAVILLQHDQRQQSEHLDETVHFIHEDEIHGCIYRGPDKHGDR